MENEAGATAMLTAESTQVYASELVPLYCGTAIDETEPCCRAKQPKGLETNANLIVPELGVMVNTCLKSTTMDLRGEPSGNPMPPGDALGGANMQAM
jgi:hypothetical protein